MNHASKILSAAAAVFSVNTEAVELYVTEDGNAFLPERKGMALHHARQAKLPEPVLVKRSEVVVASSQREAREKEAADAKAKAEKEAKEKEAADAKAKAEKAAKAPAKVANKRK